MLRRPGRRLRHGRWRRSRATARSVADFIGKANNDRPGDRRARADLERELPEASRRSCASCKPDDGAARRASPTRRRRCSTDLGARRPTLNRFMIAARAVLARRRLPASSRSGERRRGRPAPALRRRDPTIKDLRDLRRERQPARDQPRRAARRACDDTGGIERLMDYLFYQVTRSTASTRRPLPARRADRQPLLDLRDRARRPAARRTSPKRRRDRASTAAPQRDELDRQRGRARRARTGGDDRPDAPRQAHGPRRAEAAPAAGSDARRRSPPALLPGQRRQAERPAPRRRRAEPRRRRRSRGPPGARQARCSTTSWGGGR